MKEKKFEDVGNRLEEERKRLDIKSKSAMAAFGDTAPSAYGNYADGIKLPSGAFLLAIASIGADVQYIITGIRSATALLADEQLLLERYRAAPAAGKQAILGAALGQQSPVVSQKYIGSVGQHIESVQGDGLSFNVTMPSGETAKRPKK